MNPRETKLTKREFVDRVRLNEQRQKKTLLFGVILIGCIFLAMGVADCAKDHGHSFMLLGFDVRDMLGALCVILIIGVVVSLVVMGVLGKGAVCPNCHKPLFGIPAQIAVATGNCGYCGEKVFEEI
jgi:hypothetical protein